MNSLAINAVIIVTESAAKKKFLCIRKFSQHFDYITDVTTEATIAI